MRRLVTIWRVCQLHHQLHHRSPQLRLGVPLVTRRPARWNPSSRSAPSNVKTTFRISGPKKRLLRRSSLSRAIPRKQAHSLETGSNSDRATSRILGPQFFHATATWDQLAPHQVWNKCQKLQYLTAGYPQWMVVAPTAGHLQRSQQQSQQNHL